MKEPLPHIITQSTDYLVKLKQQARPLMQASQPWASDSQRLPTPARQESLFADLRRKLQSFQRSEVTTDKARPAMLAKPSFKLDPLTVADSLKRRQFKQTYLRLQMSKETSQEKVVLEARQKEESS